MYTCVGVSIQSKHWFADKKWTDVHVHSLDWHEGALGRQDIHVTWDVQLQLFTTSTLDGDVCKQLQAPPALTPAREVEALA
jgi:hypothetical protein